MNIVLTEKQIYERIVELGREITAAYEGTPLTALVLLNGGLPFAGELIRQIKMPIQVDSLAVASYSGTVREALTFRSQMKLSPRGRNILLIDDVLDSGFTLNNLKNHLLSLGALSVKTAVLVRKAANRSANIETDFVGFDLPDKFLIGFGMDADEEYRNLPYIATL